LRVGPGFKSSRLIGTIVGVAALVVTATGCSRAVSSNSSDGQIASCVVSDLDGRSVARVWDDVTLELIRQVVPAPTVHARNLFHTSAAMWDAWAAYDPTADGYFVTEKRDAADVNAARETAMSFAAYRVLLWRYATVSDLQATRKTLDDVMASLCHRIDFVSVEGDSPAAFGNRIAAAVLAAGAEDGALEEERYVDHSYRPVNDPMVVSDSGTVMDDPNSWQPLSLGLQLSQNGVPIPGNVQTFIGSQWGHVTPFALEPSPDGLPIDPGPPPRLSEPESDAAFKQAAVDVIRYSAELDPADGLVIDISPGALGNNALGTNDGGGRDVNPATSQPYAPDPVLRADFGRTVAEYWADGPDSETPPGHWNVIANAVAATPGFERRIGGAGPVVDQLEWDVKTYLALNGALHDAAVSTWGTKRFYDSARPISMIRLLGGNGQSSDPDGPAYDVAGLPLVPGLIEVVTPVSSAPGQPHERFVDHVGEVVINAWRGSPTDPASEVSGVGWIRAVDWVPYQRPTFVSPAFAGYVSGHSAFSRAGAEVMSAMTGDEFFPGGLFEWTVGEGQLLHENGPSEDVTLQWATYFDAADQAGISRLYGGIHIGQDDIEGRKIGAVCGTTAWALARTYFDGTATP
jgi:hypothetical protein